jgi:hypothetical protein
MKVIRDSSEQFDFVSGRVHSRDDEASVIYIDFVFTI